MSKSTMAINVWKVDRRVLDSAPAMSMSATSGVTGLTGLGNGGQPLAVADMDTARAVLLGLRAADPDGVYFITEARLTYNVECGDPVVAGAVTRWWNTLNDEGPK